MMTNRTNEPERRENLLGAYLRDRRARIDPAALGLVPTRRRTPGLRREEVAQRACISATWYTWLEQGRGGAPSAEVLHRIAAALMLTDIEREHLFLLGLGRPPQARYRSPEGPSALLQRVLDALEFSPAIMRTATWDIVAWNHAARVVLTDYAAIPPQQRNILRMMFGRPDIRAAQHDWHSVARFVVGAFRADAARAGAVSEIADLVAELCETSAEFAALWRENDVGEHGSGIKLLHHPQLGALKLEYASFAVQDRTDLSMMVYNAADPADALRLRAFINTQAIAA